MATVVRTKENVVAAQQPDGTFIEERTPVRVFVHCFNPACAQYHDLQKGLNFEVEVPGLKDTTTWLCSDLGGDSNAVDRSSDSWFAENPDDPGKSYEPMCDGCGLPLNVSPDPSRKLQRNNIGPGDGLEGQQRAAALAAQKVAADRSVEDDAKAAEIAELRQAVADLQKSMVPKRGPGRPRKDGSPAQPRTPEGEED